MHKIKHIKVKVGGKDPTLNKAEKHPLPNHPPIGHFCHFAFLILSTKKRKPGENEVRKTRKRHLSYSFHLFFPVKA